MKNSETILIDKYITGKLEDTELWEFKADLEKNPDLAQQVKLRREIYNTISNSKKMELLNTLSKMKADKQKRIFGINIYSRQIQTIAASIIVLMIVGASLLSNQIGNNYNTNYEIYTEYFVDEGSLITTRSVSDLSTDNSEVENGIRMYDTKQYEKAVSILDSKPNNVTARLYLGLAYMKLEMYVKAEEQFEYIINNRDNIFIDQAEWNLGLSYLANDKTKQATSIFEKIASDAGAYSSKASEIIKKLENN